MLKDAVNRERFRKESSIGFTKILVNLIVISPMLKDYLLEQYNATNDRLAKAIVNQEDWEKADPWLEYKVVEKELKNMSIFSDSFLMMLNTQWHILGHAYNPWTDFNKHYKD